MDDPPGPSKRLRKTTIIDLNVNNNIKNRTFDVDIHTGNSLTGGNRDISDTSEDVEENIEPIKQNFMSGIWHEEKYVAEPIPFIGITTGLVSHPGNKPNDFFKLCFNDELFAFIVDQTNIHAEEIFLNEHMTGNSSITEWKASWKTLTVDEFKIFLGFLFHMGRITTNGLTEYFKRGYLFDLPCFNSPMTRDRWMLILRFLCFAKKPTQDEPQSKNRLYKINPLLDIFHKNINRIQYPTRELSVNRSVIVWSQKYGIRIYILTDAFGLVLKCIVNFGSNENEGYILNTVKKLLKGKLGLGHSLYMDSYFNSLEVAQFLLNNNTYCTGILQSDRINNPQEVMDTKLKDGEIIQRFTQEGTCIMKWTDWTTRLAISTEYDGTLVTVIDKSGTEVTEPEAILECNKFMDVIEHPDRLSLLYSSFKHETLKWYKLLAIHIFHINLVNSHNLFNRYSGSTLSFYDFRLSIIEILIKEGLETTSTPRYISSLKPRSRNHYPKLVGNKKVRQCQECVKTQKRSETDIYCPTCPGEPGLCVHPCFKNYHK